MQYSLALSLLTVLLSIWIHSSSLLGQEGYIPSDYQLVYEQDFSTPQAFRDYEMTDERAWRQTPVDQGGTLELFGKSHYEPRIRSPYSIAMLRDLLVGDFILELRLAQSGKAYGHRDLCLFWGIQSAHNFYYAHLATKADEHANNIFIVNDEARKHIASVTSSGTDWGATTSWHAARIERKLQEGTIKVYFDDFSSPVMIAEDSHFHIGHIGFGSFDDTGQFDDIKIWAPKIYKPSTTFFGVPR